MDWQGNDIMKIIYTIMQPEGANQMALQLSNRGDPVIQSNSRKKQIARGPSEDN